MTPIGRTSVRTVLLTSFLLISAVLVVSMRTEDVATLEYDLGPLPATSERQPARLDTDASAADHRQGRKSLQTESPSSKAKREQMLRNILAARRRQILSQRSHDSPRFLSSRTPRPGDITSKDPLDILESQETRHNIYVTSARTESLIKEETSQSSRKSVEKVTSIDLDSTELEIKLQTPKSPKEETLSTSEKYESFSSMSSSLITPILTLSTNQKSGDAETRKKNTVSMPESLYNHFRPVESNIPVEDMSQFLYFGQKLQPDAQNVTSSSSNNNSVETTSTVPTSSRRRYSTKRFSATIAMPMEEIVNDEMNIALERRTVEKNQVSRIKNTFRSSSSGLYSRKSRPTADVVSNIIPGNESSLVGGGSDTRSEMNAVDDKFRRDPSAHADTRTRERGTATHVAEASTTTQISRQHDDEAETSVAESEISVKFTNETVATSNGIAKNLKANDFGKDDEKEVTTAKAETKKAKEMEGKLTGIEKTTSPKANSASKSRESVETSRTVESTSTLRIVVPDDSLELASFAIENERTHRNTVKQQPVEDPVADRPVPVSTGDDVAPKSLPLSTTSSSATKEPSVPVVAVDSNQQQQQPQQQQHPQQHVYAYTITNVTRLLRNYTGPGLSDEEGRRGGGGGDGAAGRAGSGAEITSGGPSRQQQQERPPPPPPPPPQSSPLLLPRASIEPARASAELSAGATVEPAAAAGTSSSAVVGGLVGERPRKVVSQQQQHQQRATSQRSIATWSTPQPIANDNVTLPTRSVKLPETGSRGSIRWNHTKLQTSEQEGANDRRFLRKSASAVLNQRSNVNDESSSLTTNKRRRVLASHSGQSSSNSRRVKSSDREKIDSAKDKLVANDRTSNETVARRGKDVDDDEVPSIGSLREVARASGVNEVPGDSSPSETNVMGNLNRNSSAIDETIDATDPSILVDAVMTTEAEKFDVLAEEMITAPSVNDEDNIEGDAEDAQGLVMSDKTSDANATTDSIVATTVTVTERIDETVATTITTTTTTTTTTMSTPTPPAPVFPVTPRILTEVEKAAVAPETFTSRPSDAAKAPEVNNLDPSEIQKRYRAKDATTTTTTTTTTMVPPNNIHLLNGTLNRKPEMPTLSTATIMENGKRVSGERSPEVRARNLSDKSKDKDDVLPIMHLYNTSDIFNGSGPMDGFARDTERPPIVLPVETESQNEETPATTMTSITTTTMTTEKTPEPTITVTSPTEIGGSTSTTVPIPKVKEPTATSSSRKDKHEENRNSQDTTATPVSKGSSFAPAANRTRYRPAYHYSIPPEYNGTMYPGGLNRTFFEADGPIAVSPRESMNISEVISKRHDGDVIATQETVAVVSYILATLVVFPIAVGVGLILRRLILRNRKVLEESDTSSEISCRKDALNLENGDFKTSIEKAITKLPRIQHLCHEAEKPPPPPSQEPRWEFPRDKLRLQTVLGQGNFGQVWKAEADDLTGHQGTTRLVAVKTIKEGASDREKEDLDRELEIMKQLGSHPNVVTLLGCCTEEKPHYLILEYVMYGKLLAYLRDHRTRQYFYNFSEDSAALTSRDLTVFGYCVARGMEYLASKKIIHRDLAARNVLVDHNKLCKIADFGMSRFANEDGEVIETRHGRNALPIRWMAPESLIYSLFTTKTDVWSFGILMWEIVTLGSTPYPDMTAREVMRNVHNGYRLERPSHCRSELFRVISRCWHADPDRRPEFQTLRRDLAQLLEDNMNGHYVDLESFASECTD